MRPEGRLFFLRFIINKTITSFLLSTTPAFVICFVYGNYRSFPPSWLITEFVIRVTRRVPHVEQELLTLPEHLSLSQGYSDIRITPSFCLCLCFVDHCLSCCPISFINCSRLTASDYPFWYLQIFLSITKDGIKTICRKRKRKCLVFRQDLDKAVNCFVAFKTKYSLHYIHKHTW